MRLSELCDGICKVPEAFRDIRISGMTADSRAVGDGFLFAALSGSRTDGARFVPDAVAAGASAILIETAPEYGLGADTAVLTSDNPRRALALFGARFHAPQPTTMVAVTGTAGKTSVANFTRQIFEFAGLAAASVGTIGVSMKGETRYGNLTTPDPITLHRILAEIASEGITHCAMEASSHGLDQYRLDGVRLKAAGFTNLGRDHLDYHTTVEDYLAAKLRLFSDVLAVDGTVVVNADSDVADRVIEISKARGQSLISVGQKGDTLRLNAIEAKGIGQALSLDGAYGPFDILLPLAGTFQASNALVAAGLAIAAGVVPDVAIGALEKLEGAIGRLDFVLQTQGGADVYVDYAHKPEALVSALSALRSFATGRLIVVFGAGGDRDPGKRPLMGQAARNGADLVIVTDDNPRTEEPSSIRAAILAAAPQAIEIGDRAEAIHYALEQSRKGDVVLVAGKGHEPGQIVGGQTLPFFDYDAVREAAKMVVAK